MVGSSVQHKICAYLRTLIMDGLLVNAKQFTLVVINHDNWACKIGIFLYMHGFGGA